MQAYQDINQEPEQKMKVSYELIERNAAQLTVTTDTDYEKAAEFARTVKTGMNEVKEYFAPMKDAAHKAHTAICDRERQMLEPLTKAEKLCKDAMSEYARKKQEEARRQEALMRKMAQEEADRRLAEALEKEKIGDAEGAELAMAQATVADQVSASAVVVASAPKVAGVSASKDYEIVSIDDQKVPISISGAIIRPVDDKAIMRLIKATGGTVTIPGVQYRETVRMSVSGRRG